MSSPRRSKQTLRKSNTSRRGTSNPSVSQQPSSSKSQSSLENSPIQELVKFEETLKELPKWNQQKVVQFFKCLFKHLDDKDISFPSASTDLDFRRPFFKKICDSLQKVLVFKHHEDYSQQKIFQDFIRYFESPFEDYFPWILSLANKNKNNVNYYHIFYGALCDLLDNDIPLTRDNLFYLKKKFTSHLQEENFPSKTVLIKTIIKVGSKNELFWNDNYFIDFYPKLVRHLYDLSLPEHAYQFNLLVKPLEPQLKDNMEFVEKTLYYQLIEADSLLKKIDFSTDSCYKFAIKLDYFYRLYELTSDGLGIKNNLHLLCAGLAMICWDKVPSADALFLTLICDFLKFSLKSKHLLEYAEKVNVNISSIFNVQLLSCLLRLSSSAEHEDDCLRLFELLNASITIVCDHNPTADLSSFINLLFSRTHRSIFATKRINELSLNMKAIVSKLLSIKNHAVQNATLIYDHIIDDLRSALMSFEFQQFSYKKSDFDIKNSIVFCRKMRRNSFVEDASYKDDKTRGIESVLFNIQLLNEFLTCENSVIFSFALQPNVCDLFLEEMPPFIVAFALNGQYEAQTVWLLKQYFNIIKKRNYFISFVPLNNNANNSVQKTYSMKELLNIEPNQLVLLKSPEKCSEKVLVEEKKPFPQNAQHLNHILTFYTDILSIPNLNEIAVYSLDCISDLFDCLLQSDNFYSILDSLNFADLFCNVAYYSHNDSNIKICEKSSEILQKFFINVNGEKYNRVGRIYLTSFLKNISNSKENIRENSLRMTSLRPSKFRLLDVYFWKLFKDIDNSRHSGHVYPEIIHLCKVVTLNKYKAEAFTNQMFLHMLTSTFFGRKPLEISSQMFQQFLLFNKPDFKLDHNIKETLSYFPFIDFKGFDQYKTLGKNLDVSLNWLCWNLVFHTVENRLKTVFGSRQDLFSQLSLRISALAQDEFKDQDKILFDNDSLTMPTETIISIRLSMNILECFSKAIFNAANRGRTTWLTDFTPATKLFFKKNFEVCKDWMNRNRRSIMFLGLKCGDYGLVIRNGEELLRDYGQNRDILSPEQVKFVMLIMTKALIQLKAPEVILGYGVWLKKLGVQLEWIEASTMEASSRYEEAVFFYREVLNNQIFPPTVMHIPSLFARNNDFSCSTFVIDFIRDRIVQCQISLGAYEEALFSKRSCPFLSSNLLNSEIDYSYLKDLNRFDFDEVLMNPPSSTIDNNFQIWDVNACYHSTQSNLLRIVKNIYLASDYNGLCEQMDNIQELIDLKLEPLISSIYISGGSAQSLPFTRIHKLCCALKEWIQNGNQNFFNEAFKPSNNNFSMEDCIVYLKWFQIFRNFSFGKDLYPVEQDLQLNIATFARKSNNIRLASSMSCQFQKSRFGCRDFENLMKKNFSADLFQYIKEASRITEADSDPQQAFDILANAWQSMLERFQFCPSGVVDQKTAEEAAKVGILLAEKIEFNPALYNQKLDWLLQLSSFQRIGDYFQEIDPRGLGRNWQELGNDRSIRCIGSLLLRAAHIGKTLPEAWNSLADWSYKWARRLDDAKNLKQDPARTETRIRSQSEDCEPQTQRYYELSANSYFKYLQYSSESVENVNATLRLLRLILKHAHQLKDTIEVGLKSTPTRPWKNITLQLFSRLNHHEVYVQKSITDLLCRIGDDDCELLLFPAIAGCMEKAVRPDENFQKEDDSEEEEEAHNTQQCYKVLLQHLEQNNFVMVNQTKLFVDELRRITVLWDELWIGTLQNNHQDIIRQIENLERDIEATRTNVNLFPNEKDLFIKEKHQIYFRRILYTLEMLQMITSETAETQHEMLFQSAFSKKIDELVDCIKNPKNFWEPRSILSVYQDTLQLLRKQAGVSISNRLEMNGISSILDSFRNTSIPIPGRRVSIHKINNTVTILQTSTKPKKITFVGNDGRYYPHLFKGHEDLHLDERIMQFLSIVNMIMSSSADISKNRHLLSRARHYSVTPLGTKSGLIEWVSGAQPLYRFYNRWLASKDFQDPLKESSSKSSPVDLFRKKLIKNKLPPDNRSEWTESGLLSIHEDLRKETPDDLIYRELWTASMSGLDYWSMSQNYTNSCALMSMIGFLLGLGDRHLDNILLDLTTGEMIHIDFSICFEKGETLKVPEKVPCRLTANIVYALGVTGTEGNFKFVCEEFLKMMRQNREMLLALLEAFVYDPLVDWTPEHEDGYTGAIYGGTRIAHLSAKGKFIPRKQMERENTEAMEKLNELMSAVDLRQVDWPQIGVQERIDIVRNGELILPKPQSEQSKLSDSETKKSRRNAYAIGVWKRIKNKFDGKKALATDDSRYTTAEQVQNIITQSTDPKNLARMYEGWTSWV